MPLWQLCWEFLGKSLKPPFPKSKNDSNYPFCKICSLRNFFQTLSRRKSETFSLKIRKCWIHFLHNFFFGRMLAWTIRMQNWWYLRHFWPESWKSSAQVHKLLEKNDFNWRVFSSENCLWTHKVQFWLTFRIFWPEARKLLAQSQKLMGKFFFWWERYSPSKIYEIIEGSFGNPVIIFSSIFWQGFAHSPKLKKETKTSKSVFLQ